MATLHEQELDPTLGQFVYPDTTTSISSMTRIIELIDDVKTTDLQEINRLIAREIAVTLSDPSVQWQAKFNTEKIKALRELAKTLQEGETLAKRDFLNFDGPKFRYVFQEIVQTFRGSLKSSGQSEDSINHILRVFREQIKARESELRKETERVTAEFFQELGNPEPAPTAGSTSIGAAK